MDCGGRLGVVKALSWMTKIKQANMYTKSCVGGWNLEPTSQGGTYMYLFRMKVGALLSRAETPYSGTGASVSKFSIQC